MKGSVIWLSLHSKLQTDIKGKQHAWKLWTQLLVGTKNCRKSLRVSHDTTLSIYDDFLQNRFILPLLMILTKLLIKSNMAICKWWVKASSALQHYYHCWTRLRHSIIPNITTSAWICGSDHHTGSMLTILRHFLECPMDPMDFNWWNSSVSFLYESIKTIWCVARHAWAIAQ